MLLYRYYISSHLQEAHMGGQGPAYVGLLRSERQLQRPRLHGLTHRLANTNLKQGHTLQKQIILYSIHLQQNELLADHAWRYVKICEIQHITNISKLSGSHCIVLTYNKMNWLRTSLIVPSLCGVNLLGVWILFTHAVEVHTHMVMSCADTPAQAWLAKSDES